MRPLRLNAMNELVSAMSALNTEVTYQGPHMNGDEFVWLPDAEPLVKHSQEHISAAIDLLLEVRKELGNLVKYVDGDKFLDYLEALRKIEEKL